MMNGRFGQVCLALAVALAAFAAPAAADWRDKVDPYLLAELGRDAAGGTEMLVVLAEQADLSGAAALGTKLEKGRFVFDALQATAARSQAPLRDELARSGRAFRQYWIVNMLWTKGDLALAQALGARADVARLAANPVSSFAVPWVGGTPEVPSAIEWNISHVNANDVWALGFTGQGAVVAGQDTGYQWDHPALKAKYRGWNGAAADHNFNWHDSIHADISGNGSNAACGFNSVVPCDDNAHGTHTMGTMIGDDGGANQIGMAPGAKWISCRNMEEGWGTAASYGECYQWFLAPTDLAGANPNPALAPDVINNSWGCPFSGVPVPGIECEGQPVNVLKAVVENLRAAGVLSVHSAGNEGSGCSTVATPAAIYDASFSVGSTTSTDSISGFSSRGPVTIDGSNRRKPDISAPGSNIRSSVPGNGYAGGWSGTSMAGPHVAGMVALLISADPTLAGHPATLEELIRESAFHPATSAQVCGGLSAQNFPNNTFGFGRIDALAAVQLRQSGFLFQDGFESGLTDDWEATVVGP